jgi:hypothetical protein
MKKDHVQCSREPEAEILVQQLYYNDVAHAMSARGQLPELWSAYARLLPKGTTAVSEWQRLSNSHAALH